MTASPLHPDAEPVAVEDVHEGDILPLATPRTITGTRTETGDDGEPVLFLDLDGADPAGPIPTGTLMHIIRG